MTSVRIVSTELVSCLDGETAYSRFGDSYELGPMDLTPPSIPTAVVFVYPNAKSAESSDSFLPLDRLRLAFSLALNYYPQLTGRFLRKENNSFCVTKLGSGAQLISAICSEALDSFRPSDGSRLKITNLPGRGNHLQSLFAQDGTKVTETPFCLLQHTRFACGSVSLGLTISHRVCDGSGYFQFMQDLAELYRALNKAEIPLQPPAPTTQLPKLAHPPCIEPYLKDLSFTDQEKQEALAFTPAILAKIDLSVFDDAHVDPSTPPTRGHVIRFSRAVLDDLKLEASNGGSLVHISTFDAITAHIHQRVYSARCAYAKASGRPVEEVMTWIAPAVNYRSPSRLNLPSRYFCNASFNPCTEIAPETLANGHLSQISQIVHDLVRSVDTESFIKTVRWVAAQDDKLAIAPTFCHDKPMMLPTQWCKFGMYAGTEFDVPAELVATPFSAVSLYDGLVVLQATEEQLATPPQESIDVNLALAAPVWDILNSDPLFWRFHRTSSVL